MRDALNATGRPILYSLCNWGTGNPHLWGKEIGNSWRTGRDVFAVWDEHAARKVHKLPGYLQSIMTAIEDADRARRTVDGPGGFKYAGFAEALHGHPRTEEEVGRRELPCGKSG